MTLTVPNTVRINFVSNCQGQISARFAPLEPEFRAEFWEANFGRPNFGPEFWGRIFWLYFFQQKRPPEKFTLKKFTSQNSPSKIQPRNRAKKFTLHLCRAVWLTPIVREHACLTTHTPLIIFTKRGKSLFSVSFESL